jgi:rhamnogalacturonyl hydrolase YesR
MRYTVSVFLLSFLVQSQNVHAQNEPHSITPHEVVQQVVQHYFERHNNFATQKDVWGNYNLDLTFEAMLFYDLLTDTDTYRNKIFEIMLLRNRQSNDTIRYESQPFCSINFALLKVSGDSAFIPPYVYESTRMSQEAKYSKEGAVYIKHKREFYLLIDYLQEYASRMSRTGYLTNDTTFFAESVMQFELYREILRNSQTGLYSQGRGWLPDRMELSPGSWSRGHGWLIRGMVTTLQALPEGSLQYVQLRDYLQELADALLAVQDSSGMWHFLLHLPLEDSYPETSGTGMIAYYLAIACQNGFLNDEKYKVAALNAANALRDQVTMGGTVLNVSPGPGPLRSIDEYLQVPGETDDNHGAQGIIYGMLAEIVLTE